MINALLVVFILFVILVLSIGLLLSGPVYKGSKSNHFDGKRFLNPSGKSAGGIKDVFKYVLTRKAEPVFFNKNAHVRNNKIPQHATENEVRIIFVNHSTFLIQIGDFNILTDPIWSRKCSPFQFAGPGRLRLPGVPFDALPKIDLVLISHNHYDHLDVNTVKQLQKEHNPKFVVPLGVAPFLNKLGITLVDELDWWENIVINGMKIHATPANHFSGRGIFDRDCTLWCGFVLEHALKIIYYVGDSGYSDVFKTIGQKFESIDIALIPIGAYKPIWFMGPIHVCPNEAIMVHKDIQSKQSIACHFGTFPLADDAPGTAEKELRQDLLKNGISEEEFVIPIEGKDYVFK